MSPIKKNREYTVEIESVSSDGNGICHIDGFTVFVPRTVSGDRARILITKVQKSFGVAVLQEIITPSNDRCDSLCAQYDRCGGCQLRHIRYGAQLEIKKNIVENAMRRIGGFSDFALDDIIGAESSDRYRNKMIFPVGKKDGKIVCGFYAPSSHDIIPLTDCALGDNLNKDIIAAVIKYMNENNVDAYDEKSHSGIIRRIFTRKAFSTGEVMVVISANANALPECDKLIAAIRGVSGKIVSIILNINTKRNNFIITEKNKTIWGKDRISDTLCGINFTVSPQSFFQINPVQTEKLYKKAAELAALDKERSVMDIYCGIGTISLLAARYSKNVIGVEIVEEAIRDAERNAVENNISNAEFHAADAESIVPELIKRGELPDTVILDPPRKGSDKTTLGAIVKANPQRIVYISCNCATLARDARFLAENGYGIASAYAFDLFPNTAHVETVILMTKSNQ